MNKLLLIVRRLFAGYQAINGLPFPAELLSMHRLNDFQHSESASVLYCGYMKSAVKVADAAA